MATNDNEITMEDLIRTMNQHLALSQEHLALTRSVTERVVVLETRMDSVEEKVDTLGERVDTLGEMVQSTNASVVRLQDDFGRFRGAYAENEAAKRIPSITRKISRANDKNLRSDKQLSRQDLETISTDFGDLSGVSDNDLDSFLESDLVWKARDRQHYADDVCYLTAEVSYTCNLNDAKRAIRHAEILKSLTQKSVYPLIIGVHLDEEAQQQVDDGQVEWFRLDDERFGPDI